MNTRANRKWLATFVATNTARQVAAALAADRRAK